MGRRKGAKLTSEQKERMVLKRASNAKKLESIVNTQNIKRKKNEVLVAAYGFTEKDTHPIPIFSSEINTFKGRMFKTLDKACRKFEEERS
jgi:hypothetical protein